MLTNDELLHAAVESGKKEMVVLLLEQGAAIDAQSKGGNTPLHTAVKRVHPEIVKVLLEGGANVHIKNHNGHTPLGVAVEKCIALQHRKHVFRDMVQAKDNIVIQNMLRQFEGIIKCAAIENLAQSESSEMTSYAQWLPREMIEDFIQFKPLGNNLFTFSQFQHYCAARNRQRAPTREANQEDAIVLSHIPHC